MGGKDFITEIEDLIYKMCRLKGLSTRGPGRRDTYHLTDFFQTFTVYEGHLRWPTTVTAKQKVTANKLYSRQNKINSRQNKINPRQNKINSRQNKENELVSGCYLHLKWYVV